MQVLKSLAKTIAVGALAIGLVGCEKASPEYERIDKIPYAEWNTFARRLPLNQRLDLHIEIMERSGHNPPMTISESFSDAPQETYALIRNRIEAGAESRYYIPVLYEINRQDNFSICDQEDRKIVQDYLWRFATNAVRPEERANFYTC